MRELHELERQQQRVLAAIRPVDGATGSPIARPLVVSSPDPTAHLLRNRSGLYVVTRWQALAAHEAAFDQPPALPAIGSLALTLAIQDPAGAYLPRLYSLSLPRDPDPANATQEDSLFLAQPVPIYPAASAPVGANWALLRISLSETASGDALGGALLRVRRDGEIIARGLSDWRGEALIPVVGVPVTTFSSDTDAVVVSEIDVTLEAVFDSAIGTRTPAARVRDGRGPERNPQVNPDVIETTAGLPTVSLDLSIAARRTERRALTLNLP